VHADRAGQQHRVARADLRRAEQQPGGHDPDPSGVQVDAVAMAAVDDLRVAGDDRHPGGAGRLAHRPGDDAQLGQGHALLEDRPDRQGQRQRPAHGQVVDRAVHRQVPHVPAGEEPRPDHVRVGGERQAQPGAGARRGGTRRARQPHRATCGQRDVEDRGVAELGEHPGQRGPLERRQEQVGDELGGQPPAAAVPHDHVRVVAQRHRAGP
jgi:hypothetical protein